MVLFKPFRSADEFTSSLVSFDQLFHHLWENSAPESARSYVAFNNDYYTSRYLARSQPDADIARYNSYKSDGNDEDLLCNDDDILSDSDPDDALDLQDDEENDLENIVHAPIQSMKYVEMIENSKACAELAAISVADGLVPISLPELSPEDIARRVAEADICATQTRRPLSSITPWQISDQPTRVQLLTHAIYDQDTLNGEALQRLPENPDELNDMPSISETASAFRLNPKQKKAFSMVGRKLLASELVGNEDQMVEFLGGHPGAGKRRVIAAVQALANKWNISDAVATVAYQGVAAQAANGQTIHKLFGWRVHNNKQWMPTTQQKEQFARIRLLIIDEISTCDVKILGMIDSSLRKLTGRPYSVFGGIHILLVGDWLQQLPVAGKPSFVELVDLLGSFTAREMESAAYFDRVRGVEAYKHVNSVVMLTENMRHQADPVWRDILSRWRCGKYLQADIDFVNQVAYRENWRHGRELLKGYCPIIVASNTLRVEFNTSTLRAYCSRVSTALHRFPAIVTRRRFAMKPKEVSALALIRDDKSGNMPLWLEFALGSPVQCTKNASPALKLTNGTIGDVVGFQPGDDDTVRVHTIDGIEICTHSVPPGVVYMKFHNCAAVQFFPDLPVGVVPVCKRAETGVNIRLPNRSFSVTITQVPIVPAFSLTTEKCQGSTVEKMRLGPLRHQTRLRPQRSSFYVAVTRVRTLRQLYLMSPITPSFLMYFTPREDVLRENSRLALLDR